MNPSLSLLFLVLLHGIVVSGDHCPGFADCSGNGLCITTPAADGQGRVVVGCQCYDDDFNGHFNGRFCESCADGYRGARCTTSEWPISPSATWFLLMGFTLTCAMCALVGVVRVVLYLSNALVNCCFGDDDDEEETADHHVVIDADTLRDPYRHPYLRTVVRREPERGPLLDDGNQSSEDGHEQEPAAGQSSSSSATAPAAPTTRAIAKAENRILERLVEDQAFHESTAAGEDTNVCKICFDLPIDCVLLECGHACVCFNCGRQLRICPFCRRPIAKVKRIFRL